MKMRLHRDEQGVSVIIGAMLLILITLLAAASLAVIISQAENKAAQNQALQTAINSEKIKIDKIALNKSLDRPGYVDQVNITIQNLNTDPSQIVTVYLNDIPSKQYNVSSIVDGQEVISSTPFNITNTASIDGGGNLKIILNTSLNSADFLGQTNITVDHTLTIQVMTRYVNVFNATFNPPNPAVSTRIESGLLNGVVRDYIVLDGSASSGDRSIVQYNWTVYDSLIKKTYYLSGKVTQFAPDSGGPIVVKLTAINDVGLEATSSNYTIPFNSHFNSQDLRIVPAVNSTMRNDSQYWGIDIKITNQMPDIANIDQIIINDGINDHISENFNVSYASQFLTDLNNVVISGSQRATIYLNFSSSDFITPFTSDVSGPIKVIVKTNNSNLFNKTLNPPTAMARVTVLSQNLGSTTQDYYQFDGSDSFSDNTIVGWYWTVSQEDNSVENVVSGKVYQYYPSSIGPYKIKLTVTDNSGLNGTSNVISMPSDSKLTSSPTPTATPTTLTAVAAISVQTQNIGAIRRDYLVLDGSGSFGGSPITDWNWTIYDGSNTSSYPGNWIDGSNVKVYPYFGKIIQYDPNSSGPFIINLTIKNSTGQTNGALNITVPGEDYFNPPVYIMIENDSINNIIVHVWGFTHLPMNNRAVNIIPQYGNLSLSMFSANTNSTGIAIFHVNSGGGTVIATTGSISTTPFAYTYT